jgi:hypothetical protein
LALNWSAGSQEPIFSSTVKAGAAAEPNSRADCNTGSNYSQSRQHININKELQLIARNIAKVQSNRIVASWVQFHVPSSELSHGEAVLLYLGVSGKNYLSQHCLLN